MVIFHSYVSLPEGGFCGSEHCSSGLGHHHLHQNLLNAMRWCRLRAICFCPRVRWSLSLWKWCDIVVDPQKNKMQLYLVGGFNHLQKYESQLGRMTSYILWKNKKMFETTNQNSTIFWYFLQLFFEFPLNLLRPLGEVRQVIVVKASIVAFKRRNPHDSSLILGKSKYSGCWDSNLASKIGFYTVDG